MSLQLVQCLEVTLTEHHEERFVLEEGFDGVEEIDLLFDGVATTGRDVYEVQHTGLQVGKGSNSLHFNSVPLVQGMVQQSRGIQHLPSHIVVVSVAHKYTLSSERVGLHVQIGIGDLVHKG